MKKWLFLFLGLIGIVLFILQIFVFEYPDGFTGYLVCLLTIISFIKLFRLSKSFRKFLKEILLLGFWG